MRKDFNAGGPDVGDWKLGSFENYRDVGISSLTILLSNDFPFFSNRISGGRSGYECKQSSGTER